MTKYIYIFYFLKKFERKMFGLSVKEVETEKEGDSDNGSFTVGGGVQRVGDKNLRSFPKPGYRFAAQRDELIRGILQNPM